MSATFSDVSTNENSDDLVVVDSDSTLSVMGSNFTSNSVTSSLLVLRSNGTAICEQISFTKNKGETADAGMLQSLEGSTLSLKRVDAISNTFDVRCILIRVLLLGVTSEENIFLTLELPFPSYRSLPSPLANQPWLHGMSSLRDIQDYPRTSSLNGKSSQLQTNPLWHCQTPASMPQKPM